MAKVLYQAWQGEDEDGVVRPRGFTLHITKADLDNHVSDIHAKDSLNNVPWSHREIVGKAVEIEIPDDYFKVYFNNILGSTIRYIDDLNPDEIYKYLEGETKYHLKREVFLIEQERV